MMYYGTQRGQNETSHKFRLPRMVCVFKLHCSEALRHHMYCTSKCEGGAAQSRWFYLTSYSAYGYGQYYNSESRYQNCGIMIMISSWRLQMVQLVFHSMLQKGFYALNMIPFILIKYDSCDAEFDIDGKLWWSKAFTTSTIEPFGEGVTVWSVSAIPLHCQVIELEVRIAYMIDWFSKQHPR